MTENKTEADENFKEDGKNSQESTSEEYEGYKGSMTDYCKSLESWLNKAYFQSIAATSAYYTALSILYPTYFNYFQQNYSNNANIAFRQNSQNFPNGFQNLNNDDFLRQGANNNNNNGFPNLNLNLPQNDHATRNHFAVFVRGLRVNGERPIFDFAIAPLWKRLAAEFVDFLILLVVKIFVTLTIIENYEFIDLESIDIDSLQDPGNLYQVAFALTSELILLELAHRIVVCFYEAYCLFKGGATPGKSLLGLRVLNCEAVYPIVSNPREIYNDNNLNLLTGRNGRIIVTPGSFLSFPKAFLRSAVKNFSLAFFFPLCFTLFHFEYNRTLYDIFAKSIVVEI